MAQDISKIIDRLNDLIALDIDAVNAYEAAIQRIEAVTIRERLLQFQQDHERHIRDLSSCVVDLDGKPRVRPDVKGYILKAFTAITSAMGDKAALKAMKGNEELTNRTYEKALEEVWPPQVLDVIQRNRQDERMHLAFIEQTLRAGEAAAPAEHV